MNEEREIPAFLQEAPIAESLTEVCCLTPAFAAMTAEPRKVKSEVFKGLRFRSIPFTVGGPKERVGLSSFHLTEADIDPASDQITFNVSTRFKIYPWRQELLKRRQLSVVLLNQGQGESSILTGRALPDEYEEYDTQRYIGYSIKQWHRVLEPNTTESIVKNSVYTREQAENLEFAFFWEDYLPYDLEY